jgi:topoisomerase IA-like protein
MVRNGPYGPYLLKKTKTAMKGTATKEKSIFVSVPKGLDVTTLTEKDLAALYTAGLEKKKAQKSNPLKKKENPTIE